VDRHESWIGNVPALRDEANKNLEVAVILARARLETSRPRSGSTSACGRLNDFPASRVCRYAKFSLPSASLMPRTAEDVAIHLHSLGRVHERAEPISGAKPGEGTYLLRGPDGTTIALQVSPPIVAVPYPRTRSTN
jgi:hypothetical protein